MVYYDVMRQSNKCLWLYSIVSSSSLLLAASHCKSSISDWCRNWTSLLMLQVNGGSNICVLKMSWRSLKVYKHSPKIWAGVSGNGISQYLQLSSRAGPKYLIGSLGPATTLQWASNQQCPVQNWTTLEYIFLGNWIIFKLRAKRGVSLFEGRS